MQTDAQRRAKARYQKQSLNHVMIAFSPREKTLYEFIQSQKPMSAYLKDLVRKDMESKGMLSD